METVEVLIQRADSLAAADRPAAIELLKAAENRPGFVPWGAFNLAKHLAAAGATEEAREWNHAALREVPDFIAGWVQSIQLARWTPRYSAAVDFVLRRVVHHEKLTEPWLLAEYLEVALQAPAAELDATLKPGMKGGLVTEPVAKAAKSLNAFVQAVRRGLDAIPQQTRHVARWRVSLLGDQPAFQLTNEVGTVNVSLLDVKGLEGWANELARPLVFALRAVLGWPAYADDQGLASMPTVSERDAITVIYWRLLHAAATRERTVRAVDATAATIESGSFWGRPGNVELWALWSYLRDPQSFLAEAEDVAERLCQAAKQKRPEDVAQSQAWWPKTNAAENLLMLSTNAGWYAKPRSARWLPRLGSTAVTSLDDWAKRYLDALCAARLFVGHSEEVLRLAALEPRLRAKQSQFWNDDRFVRLLDGARVVFVTAYAEDIDSHLESGGLRALWREFGLASGPESLLTVQAPMSVWPYMPDHDWSETFQKLLTKAKRAVHESRATLFLAACGAYGLPLVHEINRSSGVTCVHYGHAINAFFGIYTNAVQKLPIYTKHLKSANWKRPTIGPDLSEIARIDGGRYVAS